jgi:hypothetical protein
MSRLAALPKHLSGLGLALLLAAGTQAQAQELPNVGFLIQAWYNQPLNASLRNDAVLPGAFNYYNLQPGFKTEGLSFRRAQIEVNGEAAPGVTYRIMADGAINTSTSNPNILQDIFAVWHTPLDGLAIKAGQYKPLQTFEGLQDPAEILFAERSQLGRVLGDPRDRGVDVSYGWGSASALHGRAVIGAFNGQGPGDPAGKSNDANTQKDWVGRLEFAFGQAHQWGLYGLSGRSDLGAPLTARTFAGPFAPTAAQVLAANDQTTNLGAYYVYQSGPLFLSGEGATGLLGRRNPSLVNGAASASLRQALDQRFLSYAFTGAYTVGRHRVAARYDLFNYNWGNRVTTAFDPYTTVGTSAAPLLANGAPVDYKPRYVETTVGYAYALSSAGFRTANVKLNYVHRTKNYLVPQGTETGVQGGDSLVLAIQVAR